MNDNSKNPNKVCFIIAHKYYRDYELSFSFGYESYLNLYINRIFENYQDALVIVVDNNSLHKEDIFSKIDNKLNVVLLDNNIESKFEIGAYQVGLSYLIDKKIDDEYDYLFLTQDNFILNKKYDLNILHKSGVRACPIVSWKQDIWCMDDVGKFLDDLDMNNNRDKITFCWCSSFVIHKSNVLTLHNLFKKLVIETRYHHCAGERFLARILWELNDHSNFDIDGDMKNLKYDCFSVNPYDDGIDSYFVKRRQTKAGNISEIEFMGYTEESDFNRSKKNI